MTNSDLVQLIEKAVVLNEVSLVSRALRLSVRQSLVITDIAHIAQPLIDLSPFVSADVMATDSHSIESQVFVAYLVLTHLIQSNNPNSLSFATTLLEKSLSLNKRLLDPITAKILFYYARLHELNNSLVDCRPRLLTALRISTLHNDYESIATTINLLLRNYIHFNLYDQAEKLVSKSTFPENASNNQLARYMYYMGKFIILLLISGRIKAIQLDYTASNQFLLQAARKAPQSDQVAGFLQSVHKLSVIVQLLMGEIPEKSLFRQPMLKDSLAPYLSITQAVRSGDLSLFQESLAKFTPVFRKDKTYTLILRLRHNVIKAGIKKISSSYSKISLRDICIKLLLDSEEDAEYIVAKAIRDGVIDAKINHEKAYMQSNVHPLILTIGKL
jgi:26S proteasome regulatory subunit N3